MVVQASYSHLVHHLIREPYWTTPLPGAALGSGWYIKGQVKVSLSRWVPGHARGGQGARLPRHRGAARPWGRILTSLDLIAAHLPSLVY